MKGLASYWRMQQKSPVLRQGFSFPSRELHGQGVVDGAESVADLGSEQAHDSDNNDGHESEDDRVLDEALTFFLGSE
jgi:hypothetical protein